MGTTTASLRFWLLAANVGVALPPQVIGVLSNHTMEFGRVLRTTAAFRVVVPPASVSKRSLSELPKPMTWDAWIQRMNERLESPLSVEMNFGSATIFIPTLLPPPAKR